MLQTPLISIHNNIRVERLSPVIKWAGGKEAELKYILPNLPQSFDRYFEPFVGGGAVFFSIDSNEMLINDKSTELMTLYELIKSGDKRFFGKLKEINGNWRLLDHIVENKSSELLDIYLQTAQLDVPELRIKDLVTEFVVQNVTEFNGTLKTTFNLDIDNFLHEIIRNMSNKISRMRVIEAEKGKLSKNDVLDNIESSVKSAFYMHFRHLYNKSQPYKISTPFAAAIFYFVREFCYASMFRYNKRGEFNVPYGGIQYNRKDFLKKILAMQSKAYQQQFAKAQLFTLDFEEFLRLNHPTKTDFIFVDPPYDTDFSTYAKNEFGRKDQERLANYLLKCKAKFMIVIKNTEFIYNIYKNKGLRIVAFNKRYVVSFQDRNNRDAEHLMIMNY
jgi:DNA adenine methylase